MEFFINHRTLLDIYKDNLAYTVEIKDKCLQKGDIVKFIEVISEVPTGRELKMKVETCLNYSAGKRKYQRISGKKALELCI